jgi:hypothetical protein
MRVAVPRIPFWLLFQPVNSMLSSQAALLLLLLPPLPLLAR